MTVPNLETQAHTTDDRGSELERLRTLVEASGTLLASLHVEDVLPRVLDLARRTLAADAYALWHRDEVSGNWTIARQHGLSAESTNSVLLAIDQATSAISLDLPLVA